MLNDPDYLIIIIMINLDVLREVTTLQVSFETDAVGQGQKEVN